MNFKFKSLTNAGVKTFEELLRKYRREVIVNLIHEELPPNRSNNITEVFNEACNEIERLENENEKIVGWEDSYLELQDKLEELKEANEAFADMITDLEEENSNLKEENIGLRETITDLLGKRLDIISRLEGKIGNLQKENERLKRTLHDIWDDENYKFMGKPMGYWQELESHARVMDFQDFIVEINRLKGEIVNLQWTCLNNGIIP